MPHDFLQDLATHAGPGVLVAGEPFPKLGPTREEDIEHFRALRPGLDLAAHVEETRARREGLFAHLTMDSTALPLLLRCLRALADGTPLLLEGPSGTGKTAIAILAATVLGAPALRVNYSSGTDMADLTSKIVPSVAVVSGSLVWSRQDGRLVQAIEAGAFLLHDEPNLAAASVLDAMLPLFERGTGTFYVAEVDRTFAVHPLTRHILTINPVTDSYQGRRPLSRPLRSRVVSYMVPQAGSEDYMAAARHLYGLAGEEPVRLGGADFRRPRSPAAHPELARIAGLDASLADALGRFAHDLEVVTTERKIGVTRHEGYVVDRRRMAQFLEVFEAGLARSVTLGTPEQAIDVVKLYNQAFRDVFLSMFTPGDDREAVLALARSLKVYPLQDGALRVACSLRVGQRVVYGGREYDIEHVLAGKVCLRSRTERFTLVEERLCTSRLKDGRILIS